MRGERNILQNFDWKSLKETANLKDLNAGRKIE
jgi:hypothetical protein